MSVTVFTTADQHNQHHELHVSQHLFTLTPQKQKPLQTTDILLFSTQVFETQIQMLIKAGWIKTLPSSGQNHLVKL